MSTFKVTLELPESIVLRTVKGEAVKWDVKKTPPHVLALILQGGGKIITTNAFNGGGKDVPESDRLAALNKRLDAWYRGEYAIVERGDSFMTQLKDHFLGEQVEAGRKIKEVEAGIGDLVRSVYGEKEKATFSRYLDAVALCLSREEGEERDEGTIRADIESELATRMQKAEEARAKAAQKIDVKAINLAAFKKA